MAKKHEAQKSKKTSASRKAVKKIASKRKRKERVRETSKIDHALIPEHVKLSEKEKNELYKKYNVTPRELPKIFISDPAIRHLDAKENDIIMIKRKSPTAGESVFYRGVINE